MPGSDAPTTPADTTSPLAPGTISPLALGTMTFGAESTEEESRSQLDDYLAAGGRLLDTADLYADGESERIIGRWLADRGGPPDDLVIDTKSRFGPGPANGASGPALRHALGASLERMGLGHSDLHIVHGWDELTPVEETLETLTALVEEGVIRSVGWSNTTGWQLQRIVTTARLRGLVVPELVQLQYSLLDRGIEWDLLPCIVEEGLSIMAWGPLGGGWLTGKYRRDERPTGATRLGEDPARGVEAYDVRNTDHTWRVLDVVASIASDHGTTPGRVAISWLSTRPAVATVILGARTPAQLADNLAAAALTLTDDEISRLTAVSAPGLPAYPHGMIETYCDVPHWRRLGTAAPSS